MMFPSISPFSNCVTNKFKNAHYKFIKINNVINNQSAQLIINDIYRVCKNLLDNSHSYKCCQVENEKEDTHQSESSSKRKGHRHRYIFISIHCIGGSVYEAMRILQAIEYARQYFTIVTIIDSVSFSIATAIFCQGDSGYRFVSKYANTMIHKPILKYNQHKDYKENENEKESKSETEIDGLNPKSNNIQIQNDDHNNTFNENDNGHAKYIQELVEDIIISSLDPNRKETFAFVNDYDTNKNVDWFLTPQQLIYYGLANYIGVPNFDFDIVFTPHITIL